MNSQSKHIFYINRCLELAEMALGNTAPNPMVGSVIVYNDKIIGEGYHCKFGGLHAEVNAISSVKDKSLLAKSTLYVNLEPCSHFGKTPPCSDFIIKHKIPKVVIGSIDINPKVSGRGVAKLENAGVKVIVGIQEKECIELNKRFIIFYEKKRPYIIIKWAQTADGFIDIKRNKDTKNAPVYINDEKELTLVHKWRTQEQAIMVGTNTALNDNPKLNARLWNGNNPIRIVLDNQLRLPNNLHLFDQSIPTIVFTSKKKESVENLTFIQIDFSSSMIDQVLEHLYKMQIQSLIIEGGSILLNNIIEKDLWDEARIFVCEKFFYEGIKAPQINNGHISTDKISSCNLYTFRNTNQSLAIPFNVS